MRSPLSVLLWTGLFVGTASQLPAQTLFGSDVSLDETGTIDTATGAWTSLGVQGIPSGESINGLAYDQANTTLYGINTSTNALVTLDQTTGAFTTVGFTSGGQFNGLAHDAAADVLYSVTTGDALYRINPANGASTFVGNGNVPDQIEGMAMDAVSGKLFGLNGQGQIFLIDPSSGVMNPLANPIGVSGNWRGLSWDNTQNRLLATLVGGGTGGQLWSVNPATGSGTLIGATTDFAQGLAQKDGPPAPTLTYSVTPMTAGQSATLSYTDAVPNSNVYLLYSLTGAGPTQTFVGPLDLSQPIQVLNVVQADAAGSGSLTITVPLAGTGRTFYTQAVNLPLGYVSNSHIIPVL
ncbi:MAG: hypothetical protein ACPG31_10345 [Planctomycetota bacterium]